MLILTGGPVLDESIGFVLYLPCCVFKPLLLTISTSIMEILEELDYKFSRFVFYQLPESQTLDQILRILEWSCHGIPWLVFTVFCVYIWPTSERFIDLLVGLLLDICFVAIIKAIVQRPRPDYAQQDDQFGVVLMDRHAFPSGHASRAMYLGRFYRSFLVQAWAVSVALSRVMLGRHHFGDIIFGSLLGLFEHHIQFAAGGLVNKVMRIPIGMVLGISKH